MQKAAECLLVPALCSWSRSLLSHPDGLDIYPRTKYCLSRSASSCYYLLMDGRLVNGKRFRLLREQAGLHRDELAELIGCSRGHIRNIETSGVSRRHQPSAVLVYRFRGICAERLDREVSLDEFSDEVDTEAADVA